MPGQHPVDGTDDKVARVWDLHSGRLGDLDFARAAGDSRLDMLQRHAPLEGRRALDHGRERDLLVDHLDHRGARSGGSA